MSGESVRMYLLDWVTVEVRGGFKDEGELLESIEERVEDETGEADPQLVSDLTGHAQRLLAEQRREEAAWVEPTVNDAVDRAFEELTARGIVALQNAGYTMSDGWEDANDAASRMKPPPRGATFFHGQDLERGVAGEGLMLAFGAYESDEAKHEAASVAIGREVCETLGRHGVATVWPGTVKKRIEIPPFPWRRRRWTQAP